MQLASLRVTQTTHTNVFQCKGLITVQGYYAMRLFLFIFVVYANYNTRVKAFFRYFFQVFGKFFSLFSCFHFHRIKSFSGLKEAKLA